MVTRLYLSCQIKFDIMNKVFFENIRNSKCLEEDYEVISFIDTCFEEVKFFVEESSYALDASRISFRSLSKEEGLIKFNLFKNLCLSFSSAMNEAKSLVDNVDRGKRLNKLFMSMEEITTKTTQRTIKSKIPLPDTDYLKVNDIAEFDVDWILKKMRNFWGKFLQVYGSVRIDILLSSKRIN